MSIRTAMNKLMGFFVGHHPAYARYHAAKKDLDRGEVEPALVELRDLDDPHTPRRVRCAVAGTLAGHAADPAEGLVHAQRALDLAYDDATRLWATQILLVAARAAGRYDLYDATARAWHAWKPSATSTISAAIGLKNTGRRGEALTLLGHAREIWKTSADLGLIQAGYLVGEGERDAGMATFDAVLRNVGQGRLTFASAIFWQLNLGWFWAVAGDETRLYEHLGRAVEIVRGQKPEWAIYVLRALRDEPDLAPYRDQPRFRALVDAATAIRDRARAGA